MYRRPHFSFSPAHFPPQAEYKKHAFFFIFASSSVDYIQFKHANH